MMEGLHLRQGQVVCRLFFEVFCGVPLICEGLSDIIPAIKTIKSDVRKCICQPSGNTTVEK